MPILAPVQKANHSAKEQQHSVVEMAIEQPAYGQVRLANELTKRGLFVSPSGVRSVWLRHDLQIFAKRLKALEARLAQEPGHVLTESQVRAMGKANFWPPFGSALKSRSHAHTPVVGDFRTR